LDHRLPEGVDHAAGHQVRNNVVSVADEFRIHVDLAQRNAAGIDRHRHRKRGGGPAALIRTGTAGGKRHIAGRRDNQTEAKDKGTKFHRAVSSVGRSG